MITFSWFDLSCPCCGITTPRLLDPGEALVECHACGRYLKRAGLEKLALLWSVDQERARQLDKLNAKGKAA